MLKDDSTIKLKVYKLMNRQQFKKSKHSIYNQNLNNNKILDFFYSYPREIDRMVL